MKNDVNAPSKRNKRKHEKKIFFVGVLKATEETSRIRTKMPRTTNTAQRKPHAPQIKFFLRKFTCLCEISGCLRVSTVLESKLIVVLRYKNRNRNRMNRNFLP